MEKNQLNLGQLIEILKNQDSDMIVEKGFTYPHSYRGYYNELAFDPTPNVSIAEMLKEAERANGSMYGGWKGGEFYMDLSTPVWYAEVGCTGTAITQDFLVQLFGILTI